MQKGKLKTEVGTWMLILTSTSVPFILFLFFFYRWYTDRATFQRTTSQLVQRQNTVLAYDAIEISRRISDLLDRAVADTRSLSLVRPSPGAYEEFLKAHLSPVYSGQTESGAAQTTGTPLYREATWLDLSGNEKLRIEDGHEADRRRLSRCLPAQLCDSAVRKELVDKPSGTVFVGNMLRLYTPQSAPENNRGAAITVGYRTAEGIYLLALDYAHLKEIQRLPIFPYDKRVTPLASYQDGNYIYFVDANYDFVTHPKYWHVAGRDPKTGEPVSPIVNDGDEGTHPLNIAAYRGERLRGYFERLLNRSFKQKAVDIFRAPNLTGTLRVLSVAPILFSKGQYAKTGVFGHVIVGCSVDFFEEPKEQFVPYY